ncbi:GNAT family N-acetyltransferase [Ulvibacterium marinum]|nr:GNAT family N-acetyltransferase [Ulvibacterium marinum]
MEETIAFIEYSMEQVENKTDLVWVILNEGLFAGCCGIHGIPTKQPHFGLWIKSGQQGKGIGKKVVNHMLPWGISNLDIEFIKYPVDKRNQKSIHLISQLNLKLSDNYEMGNQKKLDVDEYRLYKIPPTH